MDVLFKKKEKKKEYFALIYDTESIDFLFCNPRTAIPERYGTVKLSSGIVEKTFLIKEPEKFAIILADIVQQNKLPQYVFIGLPMQIFDLLRFKLPKLTQSDFSQIVSDMIHRESLLRMAKQEIATAYDLLNEFVYEGAHTLEVLAKAVSKKVLDSIISAVSSAGLKLLGVDIAVLSLAKVYTNLNQKQGISNLMLNLRVGSCDFIIWENSQPRYWKYISFGSSDPGKLEGEVKRYITHYQLKINSDYPFREILCYGDNLAFTEISGLAALNMEIPWPVKPELYGLCLPQTVKPFAQEFISFEDENDLSWINNLAQYIFMLTSTIILSSQIYFQFAIEKVDKFVKVNRTSMELVNQLEDTSKKIAQSNEKMQQSLEKVVKEYQRIKQSNIQYGDVIYNILLSMNSKIEAKSFSFESGGKVILIGNASSKNDVIDLLQAMEENSWFQNVELSQLQELAEENDSDDNSKVVNQNKWNFSIRAQAVIGN